MVYSSGRAISREGDVTSIFPLLLVEVLLRLIDAVSFPRILRSSGVL